MTAVDPLRRRIMQSVARKNTPPEMRVRRLLHRLGYRFRIHRRDLAGTPDIVLSRHKLAIFVHGCFWHRHEGCRRATIPKTRTEFWAEKFARNTERDTRKANELRLAGWRVSVIWECETQDEEALKAQLKNLLVGWRDGSSIVGS